MTIPEVAAARGSGAPGRSPMALLAASVFAVAATIHYQTPMLGAMGAEFGADAAAVGWVATLSFGGFLAGILFLVPLGDRMDKRRLVLAQLSVLIPALLAMAAAPTLPILAGASFIVGVSASLCQTIVPIVAELAPPDARGRSLGTVLTALFLGILFGRLCGGFVAANVGWRWMYVFGAAVCLALAPFLLRRLPSMPTKTRLAYWPLMASIARLPARHPVLRRVAANQFLIGISYGGFWGTLAPMLALLHHLGPAEAGLMAIPGAAGVFVARPAGRWTDRRGVIPVVTSGICVVLAAFVVFTFAPFSIGAIVGGAVLLDCGLRAIMVANQTHVNSVVPEARSRFNTVFGVSVWTGNASGAFLASTALTRSGWPAVCAVAVTASCLALLLHLRVARGAEPDGRT